ncbi:MAG: RNA polymerase sigma factor [bacterium]
MSFRRGKSLEQQLVALLYRRMKPHRASPGRSHSVRDPEEADCFLKGRQEFRKSKMKAQMTSAPRRQRPARVAVPPERHCTDDHESIESALTRILVDRRGYFLRYLQGRIGNRDDAEDLLQDFQVRVLCKADQIKDTDSTMAWLRAVLRSMLADHFRRKVAERRAYEVFGAEWSLIFSEEEPAATEDEASERFTCTCFYRLMPILKPEYTDVLSRVDLAKQSRAQAADDLGISRSNLRVRLYRARQALKDALQHSCPQCHERKCFDSRRSEASTIC